MKVTSIAAFAVASFITPELGAMTNSTGTPSFLPSAIARSTVTPCGSPLASLVTKSVEAAGAATMPTRSIPVGTSCLIASSSFADVALHSIGPQWRRLAIGHCPRRAEHGPFAPPAGRTAMTTSSPTIAEKRRVFHKLHEAGCFVIPNPWNVGSARYLHGLGFKALATTSSGHAHAQGYADGALDLDQVLAHFHEIAEAADVPLNADFEDGLADDLAGLAE